MQSQTFLPEEAIFTVTVSNGICGQVIFSKNMFSGIDMLSLQMLIKNCFTLSKM